MKGSLDEVVGGGEPAASAAKDIIAAIKDGDAKGLNLALKRHYAACEGEDEGEYEAGDEEKD